MLTLNLRPAALLPDVLGPSASAKADGLKLTDFGRLLLPLASLLVRELLSWGTTLLLASQAGSWCLSDGRSAKPAAPAAASALMGWLRYTPLLWVAWPFSAPKGFVGPKPVRW